MSSPVRWLFATASIAAIWGCGGATGDLMNAGDSTTSGGSDTSAAGSPGNAGSGNTASGGDAPVGGTTATGGTSGGGDLPCDVQQLISTKCLTCHQINPPGLLLTSADFRQPSKSDPAKTVGELAVVRLQATGAQRMPPAPLDAATPSEIAALSNWVKAGAMATTCGSGAVTPPPPNPYDTPVTCTSMKNWTGGNSESPLMRPGGACISCHSRGEGPRFSVAGTAYPSAHEPDNCNGASSGGAQVVITEANGTVHQLTLNAAGNFYLESRTFAYPYTAKVVYQGRERAMVEAQKSGDCNDCHTESGSQNAPGRIMLP